MKSAVAVDLWHWRHRLDSRRNSHRICSVVQYVEAAATYVLIDISVTWFSI